MVNENGMAGSPECVTATMEAMRASRKPDFTVVAAQLGRTWDHPSSKGFVLIWETVSAGFGELAFCVDKDGKLSCDFEGMSKRFVREVFNKFMGSV